MNRRRLTPALSPDDAGAEASMRSAFAGTQVDRPDLLARVAAAHAQRARDDLLRSLRVVDDVAGTHITIDGRPLLNFASNDYLGLAQHPSVRDAAVRAIARWGVGAS